MSSKNFHLFNDPTVPFGVIFFSLLIILLPIALVTGPAIPDIFISIIALYFLILSLSRNLWHYYHHPIIYGFIIFCLYGVLRSLFSEMPMQSLTNEGSVFYFRYLLFALGVVYLIIHNPYLTKYLTIVLISTILIVAFDAYYQYFTGFNLTGNPSLSGQKRLTGFFGDEPIVGRYMAYLAPLVFALVYQSFQFNKKIILLSILFLIICEVIVFLSGERAPFFYISTFSILLVIFIPKYRIQRLIGLVITFLAIFIILEIKPEAKQRMVDTTFNQVSSTIIPYMPYSPHHEEHYIGALKMAKDKPIFGIGTNLFRYVCDRPEYVYKRSCTSHPHNYYIQILAEKGVVGLLFLLIFYGYFCYLALKQFYFLILKKTQKLIPFDQFLWIIVILVFWWPLIPTMSFYNNWNNIFLFITLALTLKSTGYLKKIK